MAEPTECIICRKHRGVFTVPGGVLYQDVLVYASHAHLTGNQGHVYRGWLVVEPRRHIPGLAELNAAEAGALGILAARLSRALKESEGAEHVYAFVIGHGIPHLHLHLLPRYPGTPREYWGMRLDEWQGAQADTQQIGALCDRIRQKLAEQ